MEVCSPPSPGYRSPAHILCWLSDAGWPYMVMRSAAPPQPRPPNGLGSPPCVVWVVGVGWESLLRLWCGVWWASFCGVGCCGNPPSSSPREGFPPPLWCGVGIPLPPPLWCGAWWGRVRAGKSWWARGGREASLVRQTIFCGRRVCSETLGCPFKCFGRPWGFLSRTTI